MPGAGRPDMETASETQELLDILIAAKQNNAVPVPELTGDPLCCEEYILLAERIS